MAKDNQIFKVSNVNTVIKKRKKEKELGITRYAERKIQHSIIFFYFSEIKNVKATSSSAHDIVTGSKLVFTALKTQNKQTKTMQLDKTYKLVVDINQMLNN